eukprot:3407662-Pyramimonas_sp.AAC.1
MWRAPRVLRLAGHRAEQVLCAECGLPAGDVRLVSSWGALEGLLEASWGSLGASWRPLGASWRPPGTILGASWGLLGA